MRCTVLQKTCAVSTLVLALAVPMFAHHVQKGSTSTMPVTTTSVKARELYVKGMEDYENLYLERCNEEWRAAVKEDPNLAVAWAWIAFNSGNPKEVTEAREKAKTLAPKLTPGEQLMISWISKVQEGDFLGGITAMNDMLEMYPRDKHLLYLAGNWLMGENGNDQAQRLFEKALNIDKNFPAALNDLAYVDARNREFDKAFAAMDRYVVLLPKEPNPQDSYGELKRMAGDFESSLAHYRAALKMDPDFVTSQLGLGDTYALMGNQEQARVEYDKAIRFAHNEADRLTYNMQKAMTYVREGNFAEADRQFLAIAGNAHAKEQDLQEAQALRHMAEYQSDDIAALKHLKLAEESLGHRTTISASDRDEEMSRILRNRVGSRSESGRKRAGGKISAATSDIGRWQPQPRHPEFMAGRGRNVADGREEIRRSHRTPGRRSGQSLHARTAGAGLLSDRTNGEAARDRSQASRHECSDHGAGAGGSSGPRQASCDLDPEAQEANRQTTRAQSTTKEFTCRFLHATSCPLWFGHLLWCRVVGPLAAYDR